MSSNFLQIHALTSWPAVLLNRDDVGFAKRIPFGGVMRTRVSSQCLKRHWRTYMGPGSLSELGLPATVRSRVSLQKYLVEPLVAEGHDPARVSGAVAAIKAEVFGESKKAKEEAAGARGSTDADEKAGKTEQVTVLGERELSFLRDLARRVVTSDAPKVADAIKAELDREARKNLNALGIGAAGVGAALFGRMVTSDNGLARGDAAVHVAHAFTVHEEAREADYFSAIDDILRDEGEAGSGHIGSTDLTSGLFYLYVVVDIRLLVKNLAGDLEAAAGVIERLVRLVATVTPGAKLGSTAPHAYALLTLVEAGDAPPRSLANSFLSPASERTDVYREAREKMAAHLAELDRVYGGVPRRFAGIGAAGFAGVEDAGSIAELGAWARGAVGVG